jgi:hypothetical protein
LLVIIRKEYKKSFASEIRDVFGDEHVDFFLRERIFHFFSQIIKSAYYDHQAYRDRKFYQQIQPIDIDQSKGSSHKA